MRAKQQGQGAGAIIPKHALELADSNCLMKENVTNYENNQTRFLVISHQAQARVFDANYKTTVVVKNDKDCPGVLGNIVNAFSQQKVNLTSIMSRPTKSQFGKYHFFIDVDGHQLDDNVAHAFDIISKQYSLTIIGSYIKVQ